MGFKSISATVVSSKVSDSWLSLEDSTFSVSVPRDCFEVSASVVLGKVDFSLACVAGIPRLYWMASSLDTGQV